MGLVLVASGQLSVTNVKTIIGPLLGGGGLAGLIRAGRR